MATLASLVVRITGNTAELNKAVGRAETRMGKFKKGASKALNAVKTAAKGLAIGGALAIAGFGGALIKSLIDTEKELRPMVERSRIGAESLQVLAEAATRAGSEDGLEAVVDSAQELQLQLGELALTGKARAVPALESLGLSAARLQAMEPEAAFRAVVAELQKIPNTANRAIAAEEIFGGTSEKLAGIVNLTAAEFAELEKNVQATTDIWSQDALDSAKEFDDSLKEMKAAITSLVTPFIASLLPALTSFANWVSENKPQILAFFTGAKEAATPFFDAFKTGIGVIMPIVKTFFQFIFNNKPILIAAIAAVGTAILLALGPGAVAVAALTGIIVIIGVVKKNWETIWGGVANFFIGIINKIIGGINGFIDKLNLLPGVAIDKIGELDEVIVQSTQTAVDWESQTGKSAEAVAGAGDAATTATPAIEGMTGATADLAEKTKTAADRINETRDAIENKRQAALDAESAISGTVLPTLAELEAKLAAEEKAIREAETAWKDLGPVTDVISRQIAGDEARKSKAAEDHVIALDQAAADQKEAHEKVATAAKEAAEDIAKAAEQAAIDTEREMGRIVDSWGKFTTAQDETIKAMEENGIDFGTLVSAMATDLGISTLDMKNDLIDLGVTFGDTMGLMEAVGREKLDKVISKFKETGSAAESTARAVQKSWGDMMLATGASQAAISAAFGQAGQGGTREGRLQSLESSLGRIASLDTGQTDSQGRDIGWWIAHWQQQLDQIRDPNNFRSSEEKGNLLRILESEIQDRLVTSAQTSGVTGNTTSAIFDAVDDYFDRGGNLSAIFDAVDAHFDAPALAAGGNIRRGGDAIVGERGPELVKLPRGAQVSPLDGSGGGGMTIIFEGPVYGVDDFDEAVNKARLRFRRAGN